MKKMYYFNPKMILKKVVLFGFLNTKRKSNPEVKTLFVLLHLTVHQSFPSH